LANVLGQKVLDGAYVAVHNPLVEPQSLRTTRRLTEAERDAIRLAYGAGHRQVDLALAFGVNQSTISRLLASEWRRGHRKEAA